MNETRSDYDGAWKEVLEQYFAEFMAFFFPHVYAEIDWSKKHEFLDQELQQVARDAELGRRRVDKLAQVWRKDGSEAWVLVHVEVQNWKDATFAERMYVYNYRLFDHYHRPVASLALLCDEQAGWKPDRYERKLWGCGIKFKFPVVKLLDYEKKWAEVDKKHPRLEESDNPFAIVTAAHLRAQETRHDTQGRKKWKLYLIRQLYKRGYERKDILNLFRFIDWIMQLPKSVEKEIWQKMREYEEVEQMTYITSVERIGIEQGIQQGIQQGRNQGVREGLLAGIELGLELKFGSAGLPLLAEIYKIEDTDVLRALHEGLKTVTKVEELRPIYQPN